MQYPLKEVLLEVTKRCNLKCLHCASSCEESVQEKELGLDEWVEVIKALARYGVEKVIFSGGEPTLVEGLSKLVLAVRENCLEYGLITNGFELKNQLLRDLGAYPPFGVGVSLDGIKATHNELRCHEKSWQQAVRTILDLKDAGIRVCAITTLSKKNVGELGRVAHLLEALEVPCWQVQLAMPAGRWANREDLMLSQEEFRQVCRQLVSFRRKIPKMQIEAADCFGMANAGYIRSKGWNGCQAGLTSMAIDSSGRIMPCLSLRGHFCGSIYDGILNVWEDSAGFDFNRKFRPEKVEGQCAACKMLAVCRGGCASQSVSTRGHFHDSPYCYHYRWQRFDSPETALPAGPSPEPVMPGGLMPDMIPASPTDHRSPASGIIKYGLPEDRSPASPGVPVVPGHSKRIPPESSDQGGIVKYGLPEKHVLPEKDSRPEKKPHSPWGPKFPLYKG